MNRQLPSPINRQPAPEKFREDWLRQQTYDNT